MEIFTLRLLLLLFHVTPPFLTGLTPFRTMVRFLNPVRYLLPSFYIPFIIVFRPEVLLLRSSSISSLSNLRTFDKSPVINRWLTYILHFISLISFLSSKLAPTGPPTCTVLIYVSCVLIPVDLPSLLKSNPVYHRFSMICPSRRRVTSFVGSSKSLLRVTLRQYTSKKGKSIKFTSQTLCQVTFLFVLDVTIKS